MSIDLHCHTRYSDGSTPLEELIQLAALRGVTTFALTDHDTIAGCKCASELGREAGVTVIPGVESPLGIRIQLVAILQHIHPRIRKNAHLIRRLIFSKSSSSQ